MKLTGWYSGNQKPVRDGVYERNISIVLKTYSWFSTKTGKWSSACFTKEDAVIENKKSAYGNPSHGEE